MIHVYVSKFVVLFSRRPGRFVEGSVPMATGSPIWPSREAEEILSIWNIQQLRYKEVQEKLKRDLFRLSIFAGIMRTKVIYLFMAIAGLQLNECVPFMDFLRNVLRVGKVSFLLWILYYRNYRSENLKYIKANFDAVYEICVNIVSAIKMQFRCVMRKSERRKEGGEREIRFDVNCRIIMRRTEVKAIYFVIICKFSSLTGFSLTG